jgi:hypothetical protein
MEKVEQTDKPLFDNLRKLINLIDSFRDVGLHEHIELPRIAVLGTSFLMQELNPVENLHFWKTLWALISYLEEQGL